MYRRLSVLLLLLLFFFHDGKAQSDLQKQIQAARAIKQRAPEKNSVRSQLPPGTDNSWRVSVTLSRSLLEASDVTSAGGGCPGRTQSSGNYTLQAGFSTDQAIGTFNGDDFDFLTDVDENLRPYTHPLKGSYTFSASANGSGSDCNGGFTSQFSGNINIDPSAVGVSFHFNKETKQGRFQIALPDHQTVNARGTGTSWSRGNPKTTSDISQYAKSTIGLKFAVCGLFQSYNYTVSKNQPVQQALMESPVNGGMATILETANGYEISYEQTKILSGGLAEGYSGTASGTYTTRVHISIISGAGSPYDAIIEPVIVDADKVSGSYEKWIPKGPAVGDQGPKTGDNKGNAIGFQVYVVDKKHPSERLAGMLYDAVFQLVEVSHEPGYCINYPVRNGDTDPDLKFDADKMSKKNVAYSQDKVRSTEYSGDKLLAIIRSNDYGSFAKLSVTVIPKYGPPITAHLKNESESIVSIPFDKNNNHLADAWEKGLGIFDKGYSPGWDDEAETGNKHNGDGITLYEEYRGVVARDKFKRLDPKKKELFIINKIGPLIRPGLGLLESAADIKVVELNSSEIRDDKIVNFNSKAFHGGDQTAIRCVKHSFSDPDATDKANGATTDDVMGLLEAKTMIDGSPVVKSPKDAIEYRVNAGRLTETQYLLKNVPHELAHGCGVKHHGADVQLKWNIAKHFAVGHDEMVVVDMNGNNILNTIFKPADDDDIAEDKGAASGNVRCLMTYDDDYEFILTKKTIAVETKRYTFTITPYGVKKENGFKKRIFANHFLHQSDRNGVECKWEAFRGCGKWELPRSISNQGLVKMQCWEPGACHRSGHLI